MTTNPRWDKTTDINPQVSTAAPPTANETCPVCDNPIPEGSAWIINDKNQRIHRMCRTVIALTPDPAPITTSPTSRLVQARAYLANGAPEKAIEEIIAHLQEKEQ